VASTSATFTLTVMTNITLPNGTLSNTATASSASDPNNANNSATATTTVQFNPQSISGLPALDGRALLVLAVVLAIVAIRSRGL
jgi:hypothetical protein